MPILVMPLSVQPVGLTYGAIRRTVMKLISRTYARRPDSVINSIGLLTGFCRELRWRHLLICVIGKKITTRWQYHSYSSSCNNTNIKLASTLGSIQHSTQSYYWAFLCKIFNCKSSSLLYLPISTVKRQCNKRNIKHGRLPEQLAARDTSFARKWNHTTTFMIHMIQLQIAIWRYPHTLLTQLQQDEYYWVPYINVSIA